mmetsp:Transcript_4391/g.12591  ORF Transcript_4391/g.12591 Transcript_4391/m.12591 type:complete len:417 (+) Transcript_4391:53-1303(+)
MQAYLPKMSIPVEKRDLGDGWVITCRGADGGDLMLSDVNIKRENLTCQIMGGDTIFFPMLSDDDDVQSITSSVATDVNPKQIPPRVSASVSPSTLTGSPSDKLDFNSSMSMLQSMAGTLMPTPSSAARSKHLESSVLDHIRDMLLQAQRFGCWQSGIGGIDQPPSDRYVASALGGLPVSSVLNCAIELWRNLEIDDDELLEIAIRDVSYQIKLQQEREETKGANTGRDGSPSNGAAASHRGASSQNDLSDTRKLLEMQHKQQQREQLVRNSIFGSTDGILPNGPTNHAAVHSRFNPRADPTVCFLEMKRLSLRLEQFQFCIQKHESKRTIFDPVFQGGGSLLVKNVSLKLRIECVKERTMKFGSEVSVPALQLRELDVQLEKVMLKVKDTGADWLLNKVVENVSCCVRQCCMCVCI